jgi:hypothetical protein
MAYNSKPKKKFDAERALADYVTVNERIMKFWEKYPDGFIHTDIIKDEGDLVVIEAKVYRNLEERKLDLPAAKGHAFEVKEDRHMINSKAHLENCETSAVGRALAMLGFEVKKGIASREEMYKVTRANESRSEASEKTSEGDNIRSIKKDAQKNAQKADEKERIAKGKESVMKVCQEKGLDNTTAMNLILYYAQGGTIDFQAVGDAYRFATQSTPEEIKALVSASNEQGGAA